MPRASLPTGEAVLLCSKRFRQLAPLHHQKLSASCGTFVACHAPQVAVASLLAATCLGSNRPGRIDPPFRRPAKGKGAPTRLPVASRQ